MRFFSRILARHNPESRPMVKACCLYYCSRKLLIVARHDDVRGMSPIGAPMTLLARESAAEEIGEAVLCSMRAARDGLTEAEGEAGMAATAELAGEPSCESLGKHWELIVTSFDQDEMQVTIMPMKRYQTGGHIVEKDDPLYSCQPDPFEVGQIIVQILSDEPPEVVPHEPSHT